MQSKTPLLMVTALVCGLGAAFGTWKLVSNAQNAPTDDEKVEVLVPVTELAAYHVFNDEKRFTVMPWPKSRLRGEVPDTITSFEQIKNKTSRHYKLRPNQPIYKDDICETMDNDINERLKPGEVAHAIQALQYRSGGGFIKVGHRINISATIQPGPGESSPTTKYLLENVEVLAVDTNAQRDQANIAAQPTSFLLRLTLSQSLYLKFYQDTSKIDFDLRKTGDSTTVGDTVIVSRGKTTPGLAYEDEAPGATQTVALEERRLKDPDEDSNVSNRLPEKKVEAAASGAGVWDEIIERYRHSVTINDSGKQRVQETNEVYTDKKKVKKEDAKKDEGKE